MADKATKKQELLRKYRAEIKAALPTVTDAQWEDAVPRLVNMANELAKLEDKGASADEIASKKNEIIEKYKVSLKVGQEGRPRARSVSRGPAKTKEQREAELRAAAAAAKERAEKLAREANEKLAKQLAELEQSQAKVAIKKAAENVARANSAAVKELAATLMEEASKNIDAAWKEVGMGKSLPEAYKPGLAKARATGMKRNNATLKNIKADDYIGRCRFCSKFCHSTRKNGAKNGSKKSANNGANAPAPAANKPAPSRGRSRAVRGKSQAPAPGPEGNF
jgi:hypothetical protein